MEGMNPQYLVISTGKVTIKYQISVTSVIGPSLASIIANQEETSWRDIEGELWPMGCRVVTSVLGWNRATPTEVEMCNVFIALVPELRHTATKNACSLAQQPLIWLIMVLTRHTWRFELSLIIHCHFFLFLLFFIQCIPFHFIFCSCNLRFAIQPQPNAWWVCTVSVCKHERYWHPTPTPDLSVQIVNFEWLWVRRWAKHGVKSECTDDEFLTDMGTGQNPALEVVFLSFFFVEATSLVINLMARPTKKYLLHRSRASRQPTPAT